MSRKSQNMYQKVIVLLTALLLSSSVCLAAPSTDNAMLATAVYVDTAGSFPFGGDFLVKAVNEVIRFKINALFLGSEVLSGNQVLRNLSRSGITDTASATVENLQNYVQNEHVNYVLLFTIHPTAVSVDMKAYSTETNSLLMDKTITRPDNSSALSTVEVFSSMIGNEIAQLYDTIKSHGTPN